MINRGLGLPPLPNLGCARLGSISFRLRTRLAEARVDPGVKHNSLNLDDGARQGAPVNFVQKQAAERKVNITEGLCASAQNLI
jgi:hypothetical protein